MLQKNIFFLFISLYLFIFASCDNTQRKNKITIIGSDTMINLVQSWAEEFIKIYPDTYLAVTGGGSGTGVASLISNMCQIASTSRKMKKKELELAWNNNINPKEYIVGMDGIAVVVHPSNPVNNLSINELSDIYTGKITNWKQLGGKDSLIVLLSREVNSGTHIYFKERVIRKGDKKSKEEFAPSALLLSSSQAIADEITNNPQAIGYYGMGYINEYQKALKISLDTTKPAYFPNIPNVISGKYPISRPLFFYTNCKPEGRLKEFIDFVLSDKGQKIVEETDFVPIKIYAD